MLSRKRFEEAVGQSDLNPYARLVCLTYANRNDYRDEVQESWPSQAWVAKWTGINKDTVSDYVTALTEDGWLIPATMHGRTQGYFLGAGQVKSKQLQKATRGKNLPVPAESNVLMEPTSDDEAVITESEQCPDGTYMHVLMEPTQCPDGTGVCPDGQELTTNNNQIEEPIEEPTTVSDEPVETKSDFLLEEKEGLPSIPPKFRRLEVVDAHAISMRYIRDLDDETKKRILDLSLSPNFMSEEGSASVRVNAAIQEVLREETS